MAVLLIPFLFVAFIVIIIALVRISFTRRADVWKHFASLHRLHYREATWTKPPAISGFFKSTVVTLTLIYRGSGNSRQTLTQATARFGVQLPQGMKLGKEGFGTSVAKFFGGQDIQLGLPELDDALRIEGQDPAGIAKLLQTGQVAQNVVNFTTGADEAVIAQQGASIVRSGHVSNAEQLLYLVERTNHAVRAIEYQLRWDPRRAGMHTPVPRRKAPWRRPVTPKAPEKQTAATGDAGAELSLADQLIAGLADDGVKESQGKFTLDRDVAREKMREFQLADPAAYVLELVQAAVAKGAEHLDFAIDSADMRLWFDGPVFTETDFDVLYSSLFTDQTDANTRARQRLAIGVNAALGVEPKYITVASRGSDQGVRLGLTPGAEDRIESVPPRELEFSPGTQIHVKSRLGQRLTDGNKKVREKLEISCRYADVPITLNGKRISGGVKLAHSFGVVPIGGHGLVGQCGFTNRLGDRTQVRLVTDGVWISSYELPNAIPGLLAVVESGRLQKDLSQSEIVQDDAWQDAMDAVYEAQGRALDTFASQLVQLLPRRDFPAPWALDLLRDQCRAFDSVEDFQTGGEAEGLALAPVWPTAAGTLLSLRGLLSLCTETGHVDHTDYEISALHLDVHRLAQAGFSGHKVLRIDWLTDPRDAAFLAHLFAGRLRSVNDRLLTYLG